MDRDPRYIMVNIGIKNGTLLTFQDVFHKTGFPKSILAKFLGTNNNRMSRLIVKPAGMSLHEIERIACYFDISTEEMFKVLITK